MSKFTDPIYIFHIAVASFFVAIPFMIMANLYTTKTIYTVTDHQTNEAQEFIDAVPRGMAHSKAVPYKGYPFTSIVGLHEDSMQPTEFKLIGVAGNSLFAYGFVFALLYVVIFAPVYLHQVVKEKRQK